MWMPCGGPPMWLLLGDPTEIEEELVVRLCTVYRVWRWKSTHRL